MPEFRGQPPNMQGSTPLVVRNNARMPRRAAPQPGSVLERIFLAYRERYAVEPTQSQIARLLKCDQTTVGEWGRSALPKGDLGITIARALNITLDWLYLGRGPRHPDAVIESKFALAIELLTRNWGEDERARTLQYLMEKDAYSKKARASMFLICSIRSHPKPGSLAARSN